jgi:hypothetical protein
VLSHVVLCLFTTITCHSDFGLAIELKENRKAEDGLYKLTGMTGSPVYMAPGRLFVILSNGGLSA